MKEKEKKKKRERAPHLFTRHQREPVGAIMEVVWLFLSCLFLCVENRRVICLVHSINTLRRQLSAT